jgi:hypothetical protein
MQLGQHYEYERAKQHSAPYFDLPETERLYHLWILGKTRMGKSTLLRSILAQDILAGRGCALFDPHGDLARDLLLLIPPERREDVVYFNPADRDYPMAFNVFEFCPLEQRDLAAENIMDAFRHIWDIGPSTPQLEQILFNAIRAVLDVPDGTLLSVKFMLTSHRYRNRVLGYVTDPIIQNFWAEDFNRLTPRDQYERALSTLNKIGQLIADRTVRNIVGQPTGTKGTDQTVALDFGQLMDGKIFIANLDRAKLGKRKSAMLGALLLAKFNTTAMGRETRTPFHIVLDECHTFGSAVFVDMLAGIGKFGLSLTLCHQYIDQLDEELREALIGNVGTTLAFKIGTSDARLIEPEFFQVSDKELTNSRPYSAYVTTANATQRLWMPPPDLKKYAESPQKIIDRCRNELARPREQVEKRIERFIARA